MAKKDIYTELAEKLGAPVSERFLRIVKEMFTPKEAEICLELYIPATCKELAEILGYDEDETAEILIAEGLKGLINSLVVDLSKFLMGALDGLDVNHTHGHAFPV